MPATAFAIAEGNRTGAVSFIEIHLIGVGGQVHHGFRHLEGRRLDVRVRRRDGVIAEVLGEFRLGMAEATGADKIPLGDGRGGPDWDWRREKDSRDVLEKSEADVRPWSTEFLFRRKLARRKNDDQPAWRFPLASDSRFSESPVREISEVDPRAPPSSWEALRLPWDREPASCDTVLSGDQATPESGAPKLPE